MSLRNGMPIKCTEPKVVCSTGSMASNSYKIDASSICYIAFLQVEMVYVRVYVLVLVTAILSATRVEGGAKLVRKFRSVPGSYLVAMKSDTTDEQLNEFVKGLGNSRHPDKPYKISRVGGLRAVTKGITAELNRDALELVSHMHDHLIEVLQTLHLSGLTTAPCDLMQI